MRTGNQTIGVGTWVEMGNNRWFCLNPHDPWSWFMFPLLTLQELVSVEKGATPVHAARGKQTRR